jgi:hypothetical protein
VRVAILCPGPSLPKTWDGNADVTIAVNRAALLHAPDWFCAGDIETFQRIKVRPRVGYCGSDYALGMVGDELPTDLQRFGWKGLPLPNQDSECNFSAVAATAFAAHLGAKSVRMYGADMCGLHDFDGDPGTWRNDARWEKERAELAGVVAHINRLGVAFERVI